MPDAPKKARRVKKAEGSTVTPEVVQRVRIVRKVKVTPDLEDITPVERVFAIVDGDNLYDFFSKIDESPAAVVRFYINNRQSPSKPTFFFSYDQQMANRDWERYSLAESLWRDAVDKIDFHYHYYDYRRKGYPDMELFVQAMLNINNFDTLMLFVHDGDYTCMVKFLQTTYNKKVELYHARYEVNNQLLGAVDVAIDMLDHFEPTQKLDSANRQSRRW